MPGVGAGVVVPGVDPVLDRVFEFGDRPVGTASDPFGGEFCEPAFDEVHPGAVGGGEMNVESPVTLQPALDLGGLVGRDVVDDDVDVEMVGDVAVDQVQELAELDGAMPWGHVSNHVTGGDIERGVQVGNFKIDTIIQ